MFKFLPDSLRGLLCVDRPMRLRQPSGAVTRHRPVESVVIGNRCFWTSFVCDVQNGHERKHFTTAHQGSGKKSTSSGRSPTSTQHHRAPLIDSHRLCYEPRPRCAVTTRLLLATCQRRCAGEAHKTQQGEDSMLVLLGYFLIAVGAGVGASGMVGYILASMLIRRYEKADRPVKVLSTGALPLDASDRSINPLAHSPVLKSACQIPGPV
jgi:hypothetical protein